jgi:hypothetical protein
MARKIVPQPKSGRLMYCTADQIHWRAHKVDVVAGGLMDHIPPSPPATPELEHDWDAVKGEWRERLTLTGLKRNRWIIIKLAVKKRDAANITVGPHEFECDADSRAELMQAVTIAQFALADGQPFSIELDKADGSTITVDAGQLKTIIRAIHTRTESIRATARILRAQIQAATTPAEVEAVQWP